MKRTASCGLSGLRAKWRGGCISRTSSALYFSWRKSGGLSRYSPLVHRLPSTAPAEAQMGIRSRWMD